MRLRAISALIVLVLAPVPAQAATPFEIRVMWAASSARVGDYPCRGVSFNGFALDVFDGTFDGFWWHHLCPTTTNGAEFQGEWTLFYVGGYFSEAIVGEIRCVLEGTVCVGSFHLTNGFGSFEGLRGEGVFRMELGVQPSASLSGQRWWEQSTKTW